MTAALLTWSESSTIETRFASPLAISDAAWSKARPSVVIAAELRGGANWQILA